MYSFGDKEYPGLAKVVEEAGEVLQVVGRLMMTHGDPHHWASSDLMADLSAEIGQLYAAIEFFKTHALNGAELSIFLENYRKKLEKFEKYRKWHREGHDKR